MRVLVLLGMLLALSNSFAEGPAWQGVPFGASAEQIAGSKLDVHKVEPRKESPDRRFYYDYEIASFELMGTSFTVQFMMGVDSNKLEQVRINAKDLGDSYATKQLYDRLSQALSEKYGTPVSQNASSQGMFGNTYERSWRSGSLVMRATALTGTPNILVLLYSVTGTGDANKL